MQFTVVIMPDKSYENLQKTSLRYINMSSLIYSNSCYLFVVQPAKIVIVFSWINWPKMYLMVNKYVDVWFSPLGDFSQVFSIMSYSQFFIPNGAMRRKLSLQWWGINKRKHFREFEKSSAPYLNIRRKRSPSTEFLQMLLQDVFTVNVCIMRWHTYLQQDKNVSTVIKSSEILGFFLRVWWSQCLSKNVVNFECFFLKGGQKACRARDFF